MCQDCWHISKKGYWCYTNRSANHQKKRYNVFFLLNLDWLMEVILVNSSNCTTISTTKPLFELIQYSVIGSPDLAISRRHALQALVFYSVLFMFSIRGSYADTARHTTLFLFFEVRGSESLFWTSEPNRTHCSERRNRIVCQWLAQDRTPMKYQMKQFTINCVEKISIRTSIFLPHIFKRTIDVFLS